MLTQLHYFLTAQYGGDDKEDAPTAATEDEEKAEGSQSSSGSDSSSDSDSVKSEPPPITSHTERVSFPERTQEEIHPSNPWKISKV